jgi:hypothetical protein
MGVKIKYADAGVEADGIVIESSGDVSIPNGDLEVGGDTINVGTFGSPASTDAGTPGDIKTDGDYIYVCKASGTWKRTALTGGY